MFALSIVPHPVSALVLLTTNTHPILTADLSTSKQTQQIGYPSQCITMIHEKLVATETASRDQQPCQQYCESVIQRCIGKSNLEALADAWKTYAAAILELATKFSKNRNLPVALDSLDVKVSDVIMNLQDNGTVITRKVFAMCGDPQVISGGLGVHARSKREVIDNRLISQSSRRLGFVEPLNLGTGSQQSAATRETVDKLTDIIDEIRRYTSGMRNLWPSLPRNICQAQNSRKPNCFERPLTAIENNVDMRFRREIEQRVAHLNLVIARVQLALRGEEIDWLVSTGAHDNNHRFPQSTTSTTPSVVAAVGSDLLDDSGDDSEEPQTSPDECGDENGSGDCGDEEPDSIEGEPIDEHNSNDLTDNLDSNNLPIDNNNNNNINALAGDDKKVEKNIASEYTSSSAPRWLSQTFILYNTFLVSCILFYHYVSAAPSAILRQNGLSFQ